MKKNALLKKQFTPAAMTTVTHRSEKVVSLVNGLVFSILFFQKCF